MIAQKSEEFPKKRALRQAAGGKGQVSGGRDQISYRALRARKNYGPLTSVTRRAGKRSASRRSFSPVAFESCGALRREGDRRKALRFSTLQLCTNAQASQRLVCTSAIFEGGMRDICGTGWDLGGFGGTGFAISLRHTQ
jgi:hypothetical protein